MEAKLFYEILKNSGFGPFVGVPCSILGPFLDVLDSKERFIATSEGEAMGIACGLYLASKKPIVFMQNSGLGNALNPIVSLSLTYKIPLLLLITLRGEPGTKDAPQHRIMGQKTESLLELLGIEYRYLTDDLQEFKKDLEHFKEKLEDNLKPTAFLLRRNVFKKEAYGDKVIGDSHRQITRSQAINEIAKALNRECAVITTTGKITREYYHCKDKIDNNFYMFGSMGCASAIGLGVAMGIEGNKKVVVIDGDGAILMKMGNLATIGNIKPKNLIHIVLDNQCHESTGGQETSSVTTALEEVARSSDYLNVCKIIEPGAIQPAVKKSLSLEGPSFILIKTSRVNQDSDKLERPKELPEEIKEQFIKQIRG